MANPSIGGITMLRIQGRLTPIGEAAEEITRPGVDGHSFVTIGKRSPPTNLLSILDVANTAAIATHVNACVALKSTLVTVVHDDGTTANNVMVLEVEFAGSKKTVTPVGGVNAGAYVVRVRWEMQATE